MSLINDALKRAQQAQPQDPPSPPPPLPPVEFAVAGRRKLAGTGGDYFVARRGRYFYRPGPVQHAPSLPGAPCGRDNQRNQWQRRYSRRWR